jgi:hypothetical protein
MIINRITAIGLIVFASVGLTAIFSGSAFGQSSEKRGKPHEKPLPKVTLEKIEYSDDEVRVSVYREMLYERVRRVSMRIDHVGATSDREEARGDVLMLAGVEVWNTVDRETHDITIDADGKMESYKVRYYAGRDFVASRDVLNSPVFGESAGKRGARLYKLAIAKGERKDTGQ